MFSLGATPSRSVEHAPQLDETSSAGRPNSVEMVVDERA
jgi:hypothetical protein